MTPDSRPLEFWRRVKRAFDTVWELDPQVRMKALDHLCPEDDELREEVRQMLIALKAADDFMEKPLIVDTSVFDPEEHVGRRIGPYLLERAIGRGGMSAVYLATRDDEGSRQGVAIKLISPALGMGEFGRRFKRERQILARLTHPNIARLLGSGKTEDGWPYLVLEYVAGLPITEHCDRKRLSIAERLAMFNTVCDAVEYAHQTQIIHRDIKPSNILVTENGSVKLLDFGIAKLIKPDNYGLTLHFTRPGFSLMTPEYASPEQVLGGEVTIASDVYSLGVVLYELLTGHRPLRFKNPTLGELVRVMREEEPARPSAVIGRLVGKAREEGQVTHGPENISAARQTTEDHLRRSLRGNLDQILLKALHKDVRHRYQSVKELRNDLSRHLAGLPVRAWRGALGYLLRKFVRRHKEAVLVAAFFALILILVWIFSL